MISYEDLRYAINESLSASYGNPSTGPWPYVIETYDDYAIACDVNGFLYARVDYTVDDSGKVTLGAVTEVSREVTYEPVTMSILDADAFEVSFSDDGDVIYTGKIFEAGHYPDKKRSYTAEELEAAAKSFRPASVNFEHMKTVLDTANNGDGPGKLEAAWVKGSEMFGRLRMKRWVFDALGKQFKVSTEWVGKQLTGLGITANPRVEDALVTAFNKNCSASSEPRSAVPPIKTFNSGGNPTMNGWQKFLSAIGLGEKEEEARAALAAAMGDDKIDPQAMFSAEPPATKPSTASPEHEAELARLRAEQADQRKQFDAMAKQSLNLKAISFANGVVGVDKRAFPGSHDSLVACYTAMAEADTQGKALFSADGAVAEGACVKAFRDFLATLPSHQYFSTEVSDSAIALGEDTKIDESLVDILASGVSAGGKG